MNKPVLVIMAAGMGSRFGGLKQITPIDSEGHIIMDFSIFDAKRAGFEEVIFVIKKENEALFREAIGERISNYMKVSYAFQELERIPEGCNIPDGRVKPYGTGHALLCCKDLIDGPFAVINADDYYGVEGYQKIYDFLTLKQDDAFYQYGMVGFLLKNTLTENGYVSRGICQTDEDGYLEDIVERVRIEARTEGVAYSEDEGCSWIPLSEDSLTSMNLFGFSKSMMDELDVRFTNFFNTTLEANPLKGEFFLPFVVDELIKEKKAKVSVLPTSDRWYGITYAEDKAGVEEAIERMKADGVYPSQLWR